MKRPIAAAGSVLGALLERADGLSQSPMTAASIGIALAVAVVTGGFATILLVLFLLVELFA